MNSTTRKLVVSAITGAAYAVITMLLAPISYGSLQFRVSEAMCILPFFVPATAAGLFIGCAISNLISAAGILDIVFGSMATLLAALCTARLGKKYRETGVLPNIWTCAAACAMPVLFNGPIIGAILAYTYTPEAFLEGFLGMSAQVAFGEAVVMMVIGLPLMRYLPKLKFFREFIASL
ncbi:MAG TPA: QueT transporter family protein [Clostridiales bacterium]|jgi:uncharacterized membrane protein|nr:QueT transporter family protein [Clostridiales bacterium]